MGINGVWSELGKGSRTSLVKLAVERFELSGRPLRVAIDAPIWLFQVRSGKGGSQPALRTLYYRLIRLLGLSIELLFVFDGLAKPPFKRNLPTAASPSFELRDAKELIQLFGFSCWESPGEAEAECALLQKNGIVDAVWSEDIDTLAFGCSYAIRNWTAEGPRAKERTHVDIYDSNSIKAGASGLDSKGMILVALMSGGDYLPSGIPKCGVKVACEAARAGFAHDLLSLTPDDDLGIHEWRQRLRHELETNESGFFRTRHKALRIPESFPDPDILNYYTSPQVSSQERLLGLRSSIIWDRQIDVIGLRKYVGTKFEWEGRVGAIKFIRRLAPSMLSRNLWSQSITKTEKKSELPYRALGPAITITGRRTGFETDAKPELRISFIPADVVGLDITDEQRDTDDGEPLNSESDGDGAPINKAQIAKGLVDDTAVKRPSNYDPFTPEKAWILEKYVRSGAHATLIQWEAQSANRLEASEQKFKARRPLAKSGMQAGAIEKYLKSCKPISHTTKSEIKSKKTS